MINNRTWDGFTRLFLSNIPFSMEIECVDERYGQKFLFGKKNNSLVYVAWPLVDEENPFHAEGEKKFGLKPVIGGGLVKYIVRDDLSKVINITGKSNKFGGVSPKTLGFYRTELLKAYQKINPELQDIVIDTFGDEIDQKLDNTIIHGLFFSQLFDRVYKL